MSEEDDGARAERAEAARARIRSWIAEDAQRIFDDLVAALAEGLDPRGQTDAISVAVKKAWIAGYDRSLVESAANLIEQGWPDPKFHLLADTGGDL